MPVVLSKLTASLSKLGSGGSLIAAVRNQLYAIPSRFSGGHAQTFVHRQPHLTTKRLLDVAHFYVIGLGFLPPIIICSIINIVCGRCELTDDPPDYSPRFWQYEDTVLKQFFVWLTNYSDQRAWEKHLAFNREVMLRIKWRKRANRVDHLIGERQDYKAWSYMPIRARWIEYNERYKSNVWENYPSFKHYTD